MLSGSMGDKEILKRKGRKVMCLANVYSYDAPNKNGAKFQMFLNRFDL